MSRASVWVDILSKRRQITRSVLGPCLKIPPDRVRQITMLLFSNLNHFSLSNSSPVFTRANVTSINGAKLRKLQTLLIGKANTRLVAIGSSRTHPYMKIGYFEVDKLHEYETFLQAIAVVSPRARCGETALYKFLLYLCYSKTTDGDVVAFTVGAAHWNQVGYGNALFTT